MKFPLAEYPGLNPFVRDWMAEDARATAFLPRRSGVAPRPPQTPRSIPRELLGELESSNRRWGSFVGEELRRWAAGETVAIIAGQQTGFAGGPLYTLAKIASLVRMKRDLEASGTPATLFFWLATEDHDYGEAATLSVPVRSIPETRDGVNRELDLLTLRATRSVESRAMVGPAVIPDALIRQLLSLFDMDRPSWLREGITFGDSFAELCATVVEEKIVYVDALLPSLRRAGAPLFEQMHAAWQPMQDAVAERSAALTEAGFAPQITPRPGEPYTFLFRIDEQNERHILHGHEPLADAAAVSTSALTRPLLQDFVFAPDIFIGGPAEVAYYAQIAPLHSLLGLPMPRVALRGHALVAPKRVARLFERFAITGSEVFTSADVILAEREAPGVEEVRRIAAEAEQELARQLTRIGEIALPAEHALARAIQRSTGHIEYHFAKLTERAIRGLARKDRERYAAVRELVATLYPDHHVQDRVAGWFAWWCEYGNHLTERLVEEIEPDRDTFAVISL